jgi:hypothetical protein
MTRHAAARANLGILGILLLAAAVSAGAEMGASVMINQDHYNTNGDVPLTLLLSERPGCGDHTPLLPKGLTECGFMGYMTGPSTINVEFRPAPK